MSQVVIHKPSGVVYLSGVTAADAGDTLALQMEATLQKIDERLALAGTDKSNLLNCMIWLKDIDRDFKEMNSYWNAWVDPDNKPCRATVESASTFTEPALPALDASHCMTSPVTAAVARPAILVEIQATASLPYVDCPVIKD